LVFDENVVNKQRHLRIATVLATYRHQTTNLWEMDTAKGKILCTGDHPWLHTRGGNWTKHNISMDREQHYVI
jgi:hypothetical protein